MKIKPIHLLKDKSYLTENFIMSSKLLGEKWDIWLKEFILTTDINILDFFASKIKKFDYSNRLRPILIELLSLEYEQLKLQINPKKRLVESSGVIKLCSNLKIMNIKYCLLEYINNNEINFEKCEYETTKDIALSFDDDSLKVKLTPLKEIDLAIINLLRNFDIKEGDFFGHLTKSNIENKKLDKKLILNRVKYLKGQQIIN